MMQKLKERNSNVELLRIVAMLMIVSYHFFSHCIVGQMAAGDLFRIPVFYKKLSIIAICYTFGNTANDVFILISGYFMSNNGNAGG